MPSALVGGLRDAHSGLPLDVILGLSLIALLPFLVVTTTAFIRIVVVLSLVRSAIGASSLPPNAVLTAVALMLSIVVMSPTIDRVTREAVNPYLHGYITE